VTRPESIVTAARYRDGVTESGEVEGPDADRADSPPPGILSSERLPVFAVEALAEYGASMVPIFGGALALAIGKARERRAAKAQHERDHYLYSLAESLQDQVDRLGKQVEDVTSRLDDPALQDLVDQGLRASGGKSDPEITDVAEAVSRILSGDGNLDDASAMLEIVSRLRRGDVAILRYLTTQVRPSEYRGVDDIARQTDTSAVRVQAALLRLDGADLVSRATSATGESRWSPTRLGVKVAEAMGESAIRRLPEGWTQDDVDLLDALIEIAETMPAMPGLDDVASELSRDPAIVDASAQLLESHGYVTRVLTFGSQYARAIGLRDEAYLWQAEQDIDAFSRIVDKIVRELVSSEEQSMTGSQQLAQNLDLHPRLVQALLRRMTGKGLVRQIGDDSRGPLYVVATEALRRAAATDEEGGTDAGASAPPP
jgi:predicted transcriptional regulator